MPNLRHFSLKIEYLRRYYDFLALKYRFNCYFKRFRLCFNRYFHHFNWKLWGFWSDFLSRLIQMMIQPLKAVVSEPGLFLQKHPSSISDLFSISRPGPWVNNWHWMPDSAQITPITSFPVQSNEAYIRHF